MRLEGNAIIAQSGGPTAVINNSICGVIQQWFAQNTGYTIYGGVGGIKGLLDGQIIDLSKQEIAVIDGLRYTPSAGLFSCRYKVSDDDQIKLVEIFKKLNIRYFFYNGGNDSMDTAYRTYQAAQAAGYEMCVIGVPKTVDNDLPFTDHCPGYGSAAKYLAATVRETGMDMECISTKNKVVITEAMGRNAGWLTAAGALARRHADDAPHLIYLPEIPFKLEKFLSDVERVYNKIGFVSIIVSEGIVNERGEYFSAGDKVDAFGHKQLSGVGVSLKNIIEDAIGISCRANTLGSAQRSAAHYASLCDAQEAYGVGAMAVQYAMEGKNGLMVIIERLNNSPYYSQFGAVPLESVANVEKKLPLDWITADGCDVTADFIKYGRPLIEGRVIVPEKNGMPDYVHLDFARGKVTL